MAFSKSHLYPTDLQSLSLQYKAMAYPARLDILFFLHEKGRSTVHEIWMGHPISEEALSGHLKILRTAQLISSIERYPYTFYELHTENFKSALTLIRSFLLRFDNLE